MVAVASGPLVYSFENGMNADLDNLVMDADSPGELRYQTDLLGGVNTITWKTSTGKTHTAVPYFAVGNSRIGESYKVWVPVLKTK